LLRESHREGKKVRKRTLANLSALSDEQIEAIRAVLAGVNLQPAPQWFEIVKSLPHGHVQAVRLAMQPVGGTVRGGWGGDGELPGAWLASGLRVPSGGGSDGRGGEIAAATAWYLDSLGQFRGKQELYTRQSPQKLRILREHAIIESAVSSNRIEGVSVDSSRVQNVLIASKPLFRDRDEEEIRGYRDALAWIHDHSSEIPLDESTFESLHAMARGQIWDAGQYKEKDGDIIERHANGQERIRSDITKPWSNAQSAGMKGNTILGLSSITYSPSLRLRTRNSKRELVKSPNPRGPRRNWFATRCASAKKIFV
jgi:hypothetical protein